MHIVPYDPFEEMRSLQKQFFGDDLFASPFRGMNTPTTDVYTDDDKQLVIETHLPNFAEKDVDVHLEGNALVVRAEKHEQETDKAKKYVVRESSSSFYRRFQLPERADSSNIKADMHEGVLKVVVPFKDLPKPKTIKVTAGRGKK